jgi:hypothetical protein
LKFFINFINEGDLKIWVSKTAKEPDDLNNDYKFNNITKFFVKDGREKTFTNEYVYFSIFS